jgi:hypothetical protein
MARLGVRGGQADELIGKWEAVSGLLDRALRERPPGASSYWLTRFAVLRGLGFVYAVAFLSLGNQLLPLIGSHGLLPAAPLLKLDPAHASRLTAFLDYPTLFWLNCSDAFLVTTCWLGFALSVAVLLGYANAILLGALWFLYLSFVQIGQIWYGFGWEFQLLETGFLAIFLCPLLDGRPFPRTPPPVVVVWLLRWLLFRVMLGAGLIKLRGDPCWRDLSCLDFHFETQPIPHPVSWLYHNLPGWVHQIGVVFNHLVEVIAPFFVFGPRIARHIAGTLIVVFQIMLISSGNLAFLNWITIVAALACFDDSVWRRIFPARLIAISERAAKSAQPSRAGLALVAVLLVGVVALSAKPVANLLSNRQIMNTSFDRLHLVNTYGAFGSVGRHRDELILEGTRDAVINDKTVWREYEWKCKPGDPNRRPCFVTPYHYRLDWLIWFAAMSDYEHHPWLVHLIWKLLHNDPGALSLLAGNPFPEGPPKFVRVELYRYEFTDWGDPSGAWWKRKRIREYLAPLSADNPQLRAYLEMHGWLGRADRSG